jgi:hypothetical protein
MSGVGTTVPILVDVDIVRVHGQRVGDGSLGDPSLLAVEVIVVTRASERGCAGGEGGRGVGD